MDGRLLRKPENVDGLKYPDFSLSMRRDVTGQGIPDLTAYIDEEEKLNPETKGDMNMDGRNPNTPEHVNGMKYPDYIMATNPYRRINVGFTSYIEDDIEQLNDNTKEEKTKYSKKTQLKIENKIKELEAKIRKLKAKQYQNKNEQTK